MDCSHHGDTFTSFGTDARAKVEVRVSECVGLFVMAVCPILHVAARYDLYSQCHKMNAGETFSLVEWIRFYTV